MWTRLTVATLADIADRISAAPDERALIDELVANLDVMAAQSGSSGVHLAAEWREPVATFRVVSTAAVGGAELQEALESTPGWRSRIATGVTTTSSVDDAPAELRAVMSASGLDTLWVVPGARSIPGSSYTLFTFSGRPRPLRSSASTSLLIVCTLLLSRAITRLSALEFERAVRDRSRGPGASPSRFTAIVELDDRGRLTRWPEGFDPDVADLADHVVDDDRRTVLEVVAELARGTDRSFEFVVRHRTGAGPARPVRLVLRARPGGGSEGMVLPAGQTGLVLPRSVADRLTPRERDVVALVASGLRVRQIAEALFVSENTVRNHLKHVFAKLHVASQAELIDLVRRSN